MRASAAQKIGSADKVQKVLQDTDVLAIDVDGTITEDDGIDALAETECGAAISQEVKAWTAKAARGEVSIGEAIDERMRLLKPNATLLASDHLREPNRLMPGAYEFIQHACYYNKVPVYLVSAGLRANCIIVANMLDLPSPSDAVYGVELVFNSFGEYVDWDTTSLTSQPCGKSQALTHIANKIKSDPKTSNTSITIIGDGSADAAAKLDGAAANFIAFGDGAHRPKINRVADATAECFFTLLNNWH
jgi:HAD superfamily phosphoserine phosphatase-like hydrolase